MRSTPSENEADGDVQGRPGGARGGVAPVEGRLPHQRQVPHQVQGRRGGRRGRSYPKPLLKREDGVFDETKGVFKVPFVAAKKGKTKVAGVLFVSFCSAANCLMQKQELEAGRRRAVGRTVNSASVNNDTSGCRGQPTRSAPAQDSPSAVAAERARRPSPSSMPSPPRWRGRFNEEQRVLLVPAVPGALRFESASASDATRPRYVRDMFDHFGTRTIKQPWGS